MNDNNPDKRASGTSPSFNWSLDFLEEIFAAGYAIVPIEPSDAMLEAGARSSDLSPATVKRVYAATLRAAGDE